jgi:type II secretory pathway pseudopilin PulG
MIPRTNFAVLLPATLLALVGAMPAHTQDAHDSEPATALSAALAAACRAQADTFVKYLTADNAAAFRAMPEDQRAAFMKRLSLSDEAGKPLISADPQQHTVLRCQTSRGSAEYRFGDGRVRENLAFIPVTVPGSHGTEFGLVRETGGWRLLSLGLLLLDIPQLSKQWVEQDFAAREDAVIQTLRGLADAIQTYVHAWGKLPESLAQLGPAPQDQISPELASLVNEHLAAGSQRGYSYRYRIVPAPDGSETAFELAAAPEDYGKTGRRSFFLDTKGKVHAADKHGAVATSDDPLIESEKAE